MSYSFSSGASMPGTDCHRHATLPKAQPLRLARLQGHEQPRDLGAERVAVVQ
jgi:hypothetical protein